MAPSRWALASHRPAAPAEIASSATAISGVLMRRLTALHPCAAGAAPARWPRSRRSSSSTCRAPGLAEAVEAAAAEAAAAAAVAEAAAVEAAVAEVAEAAEEADRAV